MVFLALRMSIDALEATEQVAMPDLERLHNTLYALESLTYFQQNVAEVMILLLRILKGPEGASLLAYLLLEPSHWH